MNELGIALTFDDVRLRTAYSECLPSDVDLITRFSTNVPLKIPIVSAPMDTVTNSLMAIALAKLGGLGIIHRNLSPEQGCSEVLTVKTHLNVLIHNPICVYSDQKMIEVLNLRSDQGLTFHSFPVLNHENQVVGLLSEESFDFCMDLEASVGSIMSTDFLSAKVPTDIDTAYKAMLQGKSKVLLLIDDQCKLTNMYVWSDVEDIMTQSRVGYNLDANGQLYVGAAIGTGEKAVENALGLQEAGANVIVIDTAHGDSKLVYETLRCLKKDSDFHTDIVVGNISEAASAKRLAKAGADGIKVGQGGGSICTTRIVAGIGCPQFTAIYNCATAIKELKLKTPICADGGIKNSGDIPIALGAGAHCVMVGRILAGTDEAPGEKINIGGIPHKSYRGMGSIGAMRDNAASRQRYGQETDSKDQLVPEGVEGAVPYQGPLSAVLHQYIEGLRRGMGYTGTKTIEDLQENAKFWRITGAGTRESHPHDITITAKAPNYPNSGGYS